MSLTDYVIAVSDGIEQDTATAAVDVLPGQVVDRQPNGTVALRTAGANTDPVLIVEGKTNRGGSVTDNIVAGEEIYVRRLPLGKIVNLRADAGAITRGDSLTIGGTNGNVVVGATNARFFAEETITIPAGGGLVRAQMLPL